MQTEIRTNNDMEEMLRRKKLADGTPPSSRSLEFVVGATTFSSLRYLHAPLTARSRALHSLRQTRYATV